MTKPVNDPFAPADKDREDAASTCEWPDCDEPGVHRAPRSRNAMRQFRWFCLDHVREYNRTWDYFAGMDESQIEADRRSDTIWNRPTWPMGSQDLRRSATLTEAHLREALRRFRAAWGGRGNGERMAAARQTPGAAERRALDVFALDPPLTMDRVKARYKELVKRHHPDANGGARAAEEKLKQVNDAYQTLTNFVIS